MSDTLVSLTRKIQSASDLQSVVRTMKAIAASGITTGYADGSYRPGATVSRGAMAAFMGRGFSRTSVGFRSLSDPAAPIVAGDDANEAVVAASASITAGAAESGTGYVVLTGTATLANSDAACPCQVVAYIGISDGTLLAPGPEYATLNATDNINQRITNMAVQAVLPLDADTTEDYSLYVLTTGATGNGELLYGGKLIATYVPFVEPDIFDAASGTNGGATVTTPEPPGALLVP